MPRPRWLRSLFGTSPRRPIRRAPLAAEALEARDLLAVFYFSGGNLFGPQQAQEGDPYWVANPSAWDNPFNWAKGDGFLVGEGVPGSGDTAVFRTGNEDGTPWVVRYEVEGGPDLTAQAGGGSCSAPLGAQVNTLNIDANWAGHSLTVGGSLRVDGGRWQTGTIFGGVLNTGGLSIAPAGPSPRVSVALGTLKNTGSVTLTGGTFQLGVETGVVPYAGALLNEGTFTLNGGLLARASNPDSHVVNVGLLGGSGTVTVAVTTPQGGVVQSGGVLDVAGSFTAAGATVRAGSGNTLTFSGNGAFPHYGSTTWSEGVTVEGGGTIRVAPVPGGNATMHLADATFHVAPLTTFSVGAADVQAGGTRVSVTGLGRLAAGGTMTFVSGDLVGVFENDGTVLLAGTSAPSGLYEDNRLNGFFRNDGTLRVAAPAVFSSGTLVNTATGLLEFAVSSGYFGSGGLVQNLGTVRVNSGVASAHVRAAFDNLGGTIDVRSGTLSLPNHFGPASNLGDERDDVFTQIGAAHTATGLSVGGTFLVAAGATLDLRSGDFFTPGGVFAGRYTGSGGGAVLIGGHMQMVQSEWVFPAGMLNWGAAGETGTSRLLGSWTNSGDLTLPAGGPDRSLRSSTLTNRGTMTLGSGARLFLIEDFQPGTSSLVNAAGATVAFAGGNLVYGRAPGSRADTFNPDHGSVVNAGTMTFAGGVTLQTILDTNAGVLDATGAGVAIRAYRGLSLNRPSTFGGTWRMRDGASFSLYGIDGNGTPSPGTFVGTAVVDGAGSSFPFLQTVTTLAGDLTVSDGATVRFGFLPGQPEFGDVTNAGRLTVTGGASVQVSGDLTLSTSSELVTGTDAGSIQVGDTAALGGVLVAAPAAGVVLPPGFTADVLTAASVTGAFAAQQLGGLVSQITPTTVTLSPRSGAADLAVSNVTVSPSGNVAPGTPITVTFTVRNLTGTAISTDWNDAVLLSSDDALDAADTRLVRTADVGGLPAYGSRTVTIPISAPAAPGTWVVIVAADSTAKVPDPDRTNNVASAAAPLRVAASELPLGVNVTPTFVGGTAYFTLTRPAGGPPLRITAAGASLAVRFAEIPTGDTADATGTGALDLPSAHGGVYFLAVTRSGASAVTVRADAAGLTLAGIDGVTGPTRVAAGDTLTLTIRGTGFTPTTQFTLGDLAAASVTRLSPTAAVVTFAVTGAARAGLLLGAADGGPAVTLPAPAFDVAATDALGRLANWAVTIDAPNEVRPQRTIRATVRFVNNSAVSQPAPVLQLAVVGASLKLPSMADAAARTSLAVLGVKATGRPDAYAPGEAGEVEIVIVPDVLDIHNSLNVLATVVAEQDFVSGLAPGAAGPVGPRDGTLTVVPLPSNFAAQLRPPTIPADAWAAQVGPNLTALFGGTYHGFADALRGAAAALAGDGGDVHDVGRLTNYLVNVADDFGAISGRYRLTTLGRGQADPFGVTAAADAEGNVLVTTAGVVRPFVPAGTGRWVGLSGDPGVLTARAGGGYVLTETDGRVTLFRPDGAFERTTDAQGRVLAAGYDGLGRLTTLTDFRGDVTSVGYTAAGRVGSVTDPVGRVTTYGYDPTGALLTSITTVMGTTTLEYTPTGFAVAAVTGPDGVRRTFEYDARGRLARTTVGGQLVTTFAYGLGTVTATNPLGHTTTLTRGEFGGATAVVDALGRNFDLSTNVNGDLTGVSAPDGTADVSVDATGNPTAVVAATGDATRLAYDAAGRLTALRDALGRLTAFGYDPAGRRTTRTDALGTTRYDFNPSGDLAGTAAPSGRYSTDTVNGLGLVTRRDYGDGSFTTYTYDAHRNVKTVTDADAGGANPRTATLDYDAADRVTRVTYPTGKAIDYRYDAAGRRDRISTSDGLVVTYGFDALGRLSTVDRDGAVEVTYGYDAAGRLASKAFANGTTTTYAHDALDRTTRIEHARGGTVLDFQAYTFSPEGRVRTLTTPDGVTTYDYDVLGQLSGVAYPDGTAVTYQYDAAGNRLGYGANDANQYTTTPAGGSFDHDADGNLLVAADPAGQAQTRYAYDARGRLVSQNGPAGNFRYEYDPFGNRTAVVRNGVRTDLLADPLGGVDGLGDVLAETTGGATTEYVTGLGVEAVFGAGGGRYLLTDVQGSVAGLTDAAGAVSASYRYDAFGAVAAQAGPDATANPLRFNGSLGVFDRGTGLLEMRARFYDPATGRFTQRDPLGLAAGDTNLYRFVGNDPVGAADPSGLQEWNRPSKYGPNYGSPGYDSRNKAMLDQDSWNFYVRGGAAVGLTLAVFAALFGGGGGGGAGGTSAIALAAVPPAVLAVGGAILVGGYIGYRNEQYIPQFLPPFPVWPQDVTTGTPAADPNYIQQLDDLAALHDPALDQAVILYVAQHDELPPASWYFDRFRELGLRVVRDPSGKLILVRRALDPNDIVGPQGFGPEGFVQPGGEFGYTVRFQNQPTATAPAQVVTVTQQLDADLDWTTFRLTGFGWGDNEFTVPAGRTSYHTRVTDAARNAVVDVNATFDPATGTLTWTLTTLDPVTFDQPLDDVDAGFLPPDDATGVGQGFVSYAVRPKAGAVTGTRYDAQAAIVFDTEAPLNTPAVFNTADAGRPSATAQPLPATTVGTSVTVTWGGADDAGGSGVAAYDVYRSVNGGAWTPWLTNTTQTSAVYTGAIGDTIAVYAVAADNVGLAQAAPAAAQAVTQLVSDAVPPTPTPSPLLVGVRDFAAGAGPGSAPRVVTYGPDGKPLVSRTVFADDFRGGVRVVVADFTGDGVADTAVGTGPGAATQVRVFDGATGDELLSLAPFEAAFTGGLYLAAGDIDGDGKAELVITPDEGGGPRVTVLHGGDFARIADFFGIDDPNFRGGARAALGDITGDGRADLVVSAGFGGGPRVSVYDGAALAAGQRVHLVNDFFLFEPALRNGAFVAVGDVDGDGFADVVGGGGPGGGPRVYALSGADLLAGRDRVLANFFAGNEDNRGGVRVSVKNLDGDARADVVVGDGTDAGSRVTGYLGKDFGGGAAPAAFGFDAFPGLTSGVFVG